MTAELAQKINAILKAAKLPQDCCEYEDGYSGGLFHRRCIGRPQHGASYGQGAINFELTEQINCCGIGVVTNMYCHNNNEQLALLKIAEELAKAGEFGMMLMTDINPKMRRAATKRGWKVIKAFNNPKTGNKIFIATKVITQASPAPAVLSLTK